MTNPIDKALKDLEARRQQIEGYRDLYTAASDALNKDLGPMFQVQYASDSLWCTIWPKTKPDMIQALRDLAKVGIRNKPRFTPYLNGQAWAYGLVDRKGRELHLFCDLSKSETCRLVRTGEKSTAVYEVKCS